MAVSAPPGGFPTLLLTLRFFFFGTVFPRVFGYSSIRRLEHRLVS
jgi:UPF0716 family protein affecting phage T7 exclusion